MASNKEMFLFLLRQNALAKKSKKVKKKRGKSSWIYPIGQEIKFKKEISNIIKKFTFLTSAEIKKKIPDWKREKRDSFSDDLENFNEEFENLKNEIFNENKSELKNLLFLIAFALADFNYTQWTRIVESNLGITYISQRLYEDEIIKEWVNNNVRLIKGLSEDYIKKINNAIVQGFREDITIHELKKKLTKINSEFMGYRSQLIARDQLSKLNSELTKQHQKDVGVSIYEWNTAMDERVRGKSGGRYAKARPSHWALHGKYCKWDDATVYADTQEEVLQGNWKKRSSIQAIQLDPGQDIQCRCFAIPVFEELIEEGNK